MTVRARLHLTEAVIEESTTRPGELWIYVHRWCSPAVARGIRDAINSWLDDIEATDPGYRATARRCECGKEADAGSACWWCGRMP